MSSNKHWFENFHETNNGANIYLRDDYSHQIKWYGDVFITLLNGCIKQFHNVMFVPRIKKSLISIFTITNQDLNVEFVKSHCVIQDMWDHFNIIAIVAFGCLYNIDVPIKSHQALESITIIIEAFWHQRYGHLNYHHLFLLQK